MVDDGEGVVEVAGEFIGRQEGAAVGELVGETSGLEGGKEEGAIVAVVELRNPDGSSYIEAVEVLVQRGAGSGAKRVGVEAGVGVAPGDGAMIFVGAGTAGLDDDAAAVATVFRRHACRDDRGFAYDEARGIHAGARVAALDDVGTVDEDRVDAGPSAADADTGAGGNVAGEGSGVFGGDASGLKRISIDAGDQQRRLQRALLRIGEVFDDGVVNGGDDVGAVFVQQRAVRGDGDGDGLLADLQHGREAGGLAGAEDDAGGGGALKALAGDGDPVLAGIESLDGEEARAVGNSCSHDTGRRVQYTHARAGDDRTAGVADSTGECALPGLGMEASEKK